MAGSLYFASRLGGFVAGVVVLILWLLVMAVFLVPFVRREFLGRDRRLHGECVWCGGKDVPPGTTCAACARLTPLAGLSFGGPVPRHQPGPLAKRASALLTSRLPFVLVILLLVAAVALVGWMVGTLVP
jgi:hypothetical protein